MQGKFERLTYKKMYFTPKTILIGLDTESTIFGTKIHATKENPRENQRKTAFISEQTF
jgi:hypothetical protein